MVEFKKLQTPKQFEKELIQLFANRFQDYRKRLIRGEEKLHATLAERKQMKHSDILLALKQEASPKHQEKSLPPS